MEVTTLYFWNAEPTLKLSASEIARELCLSQKTISTHRSRILDKMQLRTNAQLTFYAIQNHLIESCPFPNGEAKTM